MDLVGVEELCVWVLRSPAEIEWLDDEIGFFCLKNV
jgi:hypothetical protein